MKLHEIITAFENDKELSYEQIAPFKKSLYTYFKDQFCCEPVLMVTFATNALQGCKIVPSDEFANCVIDYIGNPDADDEGSEDFAEYETINFNSKMMADIL